MSGMQEGTRNDTITNLPLQHSDILLFVFSLTDSVMGVNSCRLYPAGMPMPTKLPLLVYSSLYWLPTSISSIVGRYAVCRKLGAKVAALLTATDYGPPSFSAVGTLSASLAIVIVVTTDRWPLTSTIVIGDLSNRFLVAAFRGQFRTTSNPIVVAVTTVIRSNDWDPSRT